MDELKDKIEAIDNSRANPDELAAAYGKLFGAAFLDNPASIRAKMREAFDILGIEGVVKLADLKGKTKLQNTAEAWYEAIAASETGKRANVRRR